MHRGRSSVAALAPFLALAVVLASAPAVADDAIPLPTGEQTDQLEPSYLLDGGAMAFLWAPALGTLFVDKYLEPRSTPLLFSSDEGGAPSKRSQEIPGAVLGVGGAVIVGAIALGDDPSRFYHAKGMAQSIVTSGFFTVTAKRIFARHRPDHDAMTSLASENRSFPSGHTTRAFSTLVYAGLYLRHHGFDQWRKPGTLPWWEVASYAGLGGLALALGGERVYHNRHHVSDVIAGGLLGTASSVAFFYYQERRFRGAKRRSSEVVAEPRPAVDAISERERRAAAPAGDPPMLTFGGSF
jgi:membrane-associated phospholipid phosphatase